MRFPFRHCFTAGAFALATSGSAVGAATVQVFAAASLTDAFTELGLVFEQRMPGVQVRFNFAGSQQLAVQLEQGAAGDVFASADDRWMNHLAGRSLLASSAQVFAHNRLVVILPVSNPARIDRLQDLARRGVKLVLAAESVPAGAYSRQVMEKLSLDPAFGPDFARRALAGVVSNEENVKAVLAKVQLGEADAGMVYRSDVTPKVQRLLRVLEIPGSANVTANYPIAVLANAPSPDAARGFVELVLSREGQDVLVKHGLMPVEVDGQRIQ